jgi:flagellar FliJ protein
MSAPFRFGLERVRDLRAHDEELAKEQFAATLSQRLRGEALLRAAEDRLRHARADAVADEVVPPLSGMDLVTPRSRPAVPA